MRHRSRLLASVPFVAAVGLLVVTALLSAGQDVTAHPGHAQKKLFAGRWYQPATAMNLTTSNTNHGETLVCDGNFFSCSPKWAGPVQFAVGDWNNQPDTVRFFVQPNFNILYDINIFVIDEIIQPGVLGVAVFYNASEQQCNPDACQYRYGEAYMADDSHVGPYGTFQSKQATVAHELGHLLNLRHESTNEVGQPPYPLYNCGQDNTGPIPVSIMAYDCIDPPPGGSGIFNVQPWDTCGVNHAYPDPAFGNEGCVCFPPAPGGAAPAGTPAYFHPLTPARVLDTRSGPGPQGKVGHGCVITVDVTGVGGVPSSGVSAVVVNATVTQPTQGSFLTLYPSGTTLPTASNLNFAPGQTIPNLVTVRVGADGNINVYNAAGQTHVILDVAGWYDSTPGSSLREVGGTLDGTVASHGGPDTIGLDTDITGNTATSLGTINPCVQTTAGSTVTVDAFVTNVPPFDDNGTPEINDDSGGIIGWQFLIQYNETPLTINAENQNFLVYSGAGSAAPFSISDPLPDTSGNNEWLSSSLDTGTGVAESGSGVLARIDIAVEAAAPNGQYTLVLDITNTAILDTTGMAFQPHSVAHAAIAVGQACGPIVTPTPPPTPSPSPSPSPSPTATATPTGGFGYYHPVAPARVWDTRPGADPGPKGKVGAGATVDVDVTGVGGVPASGVSAVVLNVTVTDPTAPSFLTVFPSDAARPNASNLNFAANETTPNLVIVKVGANGNVKVYNAAGQTHVIFDVAGWFGGIGTDGTLFRSLSPSRILDTRSSPQGVPPGKVDPGETITVTVNGRGGVPQSGATAVILNATVTEPTTGSFLTVFPGGTTRPNASNLNFGPSETVPNLVIVKIGTDGTVRVYNAAGSVHVIFDVAGWYGP